MIRNFYNNILNSCKVRLAPVVLKTLKSPATRRFIIKVFNKIKADVMIYPLDLPPIEVREDLDLLLLELPPRYEPMMPNGVGYVHNLLKKFDIRFQTLDLNLITYHEFHSERLLGNSHIITPSGYEMKDDPWDNINTSEWNRLEVVEYFFDKLNVLIEDIVKKKPKAVGISVHANCRGIANKFIKKLREKAPAVKIIIGGYDCVYRYIDPSLVPDFDYMAIGDTELTLGPLVTALARGERPKDLTGIISRYDTTDRQWKDPPVIENLDDIDYPTYDWIDSSLYKKFTGAAFELPITSSRGCK